MTRFGRRRAVAVLGPEVGPDGRSWTPVEHHSVHEDSAEDHQLVGRDGRLGATRTFALIDEVRQELDAEASPPNFTFPSKLALLEPADIMARSSGPLRFNPEFSLLPSDDFGEHVESQPGFFISVIAAEMALPDAVTRSRMSSADARDATEHALVAAQEENVRELAMWRVELPEAAAANLRPRRCWRHGTAWPEEDPPEPELRPLDERVFEQIGDVLLSQVDRATTFELVQTTYFCPMTAEWVSMPTPDRPQHSLLAVRVGRHTTRSDIKNFLSRVRYSTEPRPDGRGERVRRCVVLEEANA